MKGRKLFLIEKNIKQDVQNSKNHNLTVNFNGILLFGLQCSMHTKKSCYFKCQFHFTYRKINFNQTKNFISASAFTI